MQGPFALGVEKRQVRWIVETSSVSIMAVSRHLGLSAPPLLRRETCSLRTPPPFLEKIFRLAVFLGEHCDSGHDPGLDEKSKKREIMDDYRTNNWRESGHVSDPGSGLKMGDFVRSMNRKWIYNALN